MLGKREAVEHFPCWRYAIDRGAKCHIRVCACVPSPWFESCWLLGVINYLEVVIWSPVGQVFAIRISALITPKFVVTIKITAYNVLVVYYRKLANVQDGVRGVVYISYACVVNFDGGPFSVGSFNRGGHIRDPDRVVVLPWTGLLEKWASV